MRVIASITRPRRNEVLGAARMVLSRGSVSSAPTLFWSGASTTERKQRGNIMIGITADDAVWIDRRQVDIRAVRANIERLHAENPEGAVVIQADRDARTGVLVQVIDQSRLAGVSDVSIAANRH